MPKQSNYQLLKDVHLVVNRIEDKFNKKFEATDAKVDMLESKMDRMYGKIGVAVAFITILVTGAVTFIFDWIRSKLT